VKSLTGDSKVAGHFIWPLVSREQRSLPHDWNLERKKVLIGKADAALPWGVAFIVIENLIDDARRENAFGPLMSLHMLIECGDAFDHRSSS
jgi:hypothetical protein